MFKFKRGVSMGWGCLLIPPRPKVKPVPELFPPDDYKYEERSREERLRVAWAKQLEGKVFVYDSSAADRRYFINELTRWVRRDGGISSLTQCCWHMTWVRNNEGRTSKYLFFNERTQRLFLDRHFFEWVTIVVKQIEVVYGG